MITETHYHGRGRPQERDGEYLHLAEPGFVYSISVWVGGHALIWGYSRMLLIDEWGLCVSKPFRRMSSPAVTTSWAEPMAKEAWIYRPAVIQLIHEEEWMTTT